MKYFIWSFLLFHSLIAFCQVSLSSGLIVFHPFEDERYYNIALIDGEGMTLRDKANNDSLIINSYAAVHDFDICENSLELDNAAAFNLGDTVLVIQMKGAVIDSSNTASFGKVISYGGAGNYEMNVIRSKTGNRVILDNVILRNYDIPKGKVQLVRVPYFANFSTDKVLTAAPWDGNKGGVLFLNASGTVTLNADISVTGKGFRHGAPMNDARITDNATGYFYDKSSNNGGQKGEGIYDIGMDKDYGRGALANGGGGGNAHNAGGGGGSNGGEGGTGGDQYEPLKNVSEEIGGIGGDALNNDATLNRLFLGGGGGMGQANDFSEFPAGNGGGIVIIKADKLELNSFKIMANGQNATEAPNAAAAKDGMPGGGGGGSIMLNAPNISSNIASYIKIEAKGGKGADQPSNLYEGRHGGGGGGGGGVVGFMQTSQPGAISIDVSGGLNGLNTGYGNDPWGSTPGKNGLIIPQMRIPVSDNNFRINIDSVAIDSEVKNCLLTVNFDGFVRTNHSPITDWKWDFGDQQIGNTQNPQHDFAQDGNYNIKFRVTDENGCMDSTSKQISVMGLVLKKSSDTSVCLNSSVQLFASGGTSYKWFPSDGLSNTNISTPTATPEKTTKYYITVSNNLPCAITDSVEVIVHALPTLQLRKSNDISCQLPTSRLSAISNAITYEWAPAKSLDNSKMSTSIAAPKETTTYTVDVTDKNNCSTIDSIKVKVDFSDKPVLVMPNSFTPNGDGLNDCFGIPPTWGKVINMDLRIYNRWGQTVFHTTDPFQCWDGRLRNEPQSSGTFYYVLSATTNCEIVNLKGSVLLIR